MLKRKIDKATFDALADAVKAFYKADGDAYTLKLEVSADDDPGELRRALTRERQEATDQKARADRLQTQVDTLVADPNKQKDIATLEASWKQKLADADDAAKKKTTKLEEQLKRSLVSDKAQTLAIKLAGDNAEVLLPHIERRLQANLDGDVPTTRVLDIHGGLSAATIDDLEKEIVANTKFGAIIIASKASGGANGNKGGSGPTAVPGNKKFHELTEVERVTFYKADPEGFAKASAEARQQR